MQLHEEIFRIKYPEEFNRIALKIFKIQAANVKIYKEFIRYLNIVPEQINTLENIPFLPIELFKTQEIIYEGQKARLIFESSGTTGIKTSRHLVASPEIYEKSLLSSFIHFYGNPGKYTLLALLPSYLERKNSSLVYMVNLLMEKTADKYSGFYLHDVEKLLKTIEILKKKKKKTILIGVSYALLEMAEKFNPDLSGIIVMETGGMKGRRPELTRKELHEILKKNLNIKNIHSEYGMTELLSQAYSQNEGIFQTPPWMKILIRDLHDPINILKDNQSGAINIIDLANIYSCSFIATSDLGMIIPERGFEISGRVKNSDIRGCNLMIS